MRFLVTTRSATEDDEPRLNKALACVIFVVFVEVDEEEEVDAEPSPFRDLGVERTDEPIAVEATEEL